MIYLQLAFIFFLFAIVSVFNLICSLFIAFPHPILTKTKRWLYFLIYKTLGVHLKIEGDISNSQPTLFISNHISYLDILILGATLPNVSFVSKSEVRKWPLIGFIAKTHGSIFVNRKKSSVKGELNAIQKALKNKRRIILFPEGTSYDGTHIKKIKSSFFNCSGIGPITIQPITLSYTHRYGIPMGRFGRWVYGWFGDVDLLSHIKQIKKHGPFRATVSFHKPFEVSDVCRKSLASHCEEILKIGMEKTINAANDHSTDPNLSPSKYQEIK